MSRKSKNFHNLKLLRVKLGLRQQDVADLLEVSRVTVGNWEAGRAMIPASAMDKIMGKFNVRREAFFEEKEVYLKDEKDAIKQEIRDVNLRLEAMERRLESILRFLKKGKGD